MSIDQETQLRQLLASAERQPALLDPQRVITRGRRRVHRQRAALGVGAVLVGASAVTGISALGGHLPWTVVQDAVPAAGAVQPLEVSGTTFGFAVRIRGVGQAPVLIEYVRDSAGAWSERAGAPGVDQGLPAIGLGSSEFPTMGYALFPGGARNIRAVFAVPVDSVVRTATLQGDDHRRYVVAVVTAPSYDLMSRLLGYTWVDAQGQQHQDLPLAGR